MSYVPVKVLNVMIWGRLVGGLALDESSGYYAFEYYPEYRNSGQELSPLLLPLATDRPVVATSLPEKTFHRLPALIADSLPDDFGNSLIDAWMTENKVRSQDFSPLDRLAYIGKRGMGALEYQPAIQRGRTRKASAVELNSLVSAARKAVSVNLREARSEGIDAELVQLIEIGTSAGGARAKAVVGWNPEDETFLSGQFDLPEGYEHWLLKFDTGKRVHSGISSHEYGRIEYAYYLMALACGIEMSPCRVYELDGRAHFMTKRFDRGVGNVRHHVQTLCAMRGLDYNALRVHDYAQMFITAEELSLPLTALDQLFARMVFNVAMSNKDDHTKNHSFLLKEGKSWELAPAYDITHAYNPSESAWTKAHIMGVGGVFTNIARDDVMRMSESFRIDGRSNIIDRVVEIAESWPEFAAKAGLSKGETERVGKDIRASSALLKK